MKRITLALATLLLALAVVPAADARVVQPPWVVVRWAYGDCKIWRNDIRANFARLESGGFPTRYQ
jgi:hypothetical protein